MWIVGVRIEFNGVSVCVCVGVPRWRISGLYAGAQWRSCSSRRAKSRAQTF